MLKKSILYITLFWSFNSLAQPYLSEGGDFSVDQIRGCRDLFMTVTNINPGEGVILYQFESKGSLVTASNTFNYTTTGNYWLYQYIQGPTNEKVDSLFIEIYDPVTVDFQLESCNNNSVIVDINNSTYDLYEIDYGDGSIVQVPVNSFVPSYNYAGGGPYNVSVAGVYTTANNRCGTNSKSFTPVLNVASAFISKLEVLDNATIILDYSLAPNTSSNLEVALNANPSYQTFKVIEQGTARDTLRGLNLNNIYCFRIASNDVCSNFKAYSNEICSIMLSTNSVSDAIKLDWQTEFLASFSSINILRDDSNLNTLSGPTITYSDSTVTCNSNYCYSIEVVNSDGAISKSNASCQLAFSNSTPENISNVSMEIVNNQIVWQWLVPQSETIGNFKVYNDDGVLLANSADTTLIQDYLNPTTCLRWDFTNSCGNSSGISGTVCPLELNYFANSDGSTRLFWNSFDGWSSGVEGYAILVFDQFMTQIDSVWVGSNLEYVDPIPADNNQVSSYRVIAVPNEDIIRNSASNILAVEREPIISLPSTFTPNGDGLNDLFEIRGKYISSQELTILNRWGEVIFYSEDSGWDGLAAGKKVSLGTYIYKAKVKDFIGKEHIRTGTVLILKD